MFSRHFCVLWVWHLSNIGCELICARLLLQFAIADGEAPGLPHQHVREELLHAAQQLAPEAAGG